MSQTSPIAHHLKAFSRWLSLAILLAGVAVLSGWIFDVAALKSVLPGLATMKPNTAVGFLLCGTTIYWLGIIDPAAPKAPAAMWLWWMRGTATLLLLLGLLTLSQYLLGLDFGIDQFLFSDPTSTRYPGRMAYMTAINFSLLGTAFLLADRRGFWLPQILALLVAFNAFLAVLGYLYGVESLYRLLPFSSVALHTAVLFLLTPLAFVCSRPQYGLAALAVRDDAGGALVRRLFPAAFLLPPLLGWLRLHGELLGFYTFEFGLALFAISNVLVFTVLVWLTGRAVSAADQKRQQSERALYDVAARFQVMVESITAYAILELDPQGRIRTWSKGAEAIKGYRADEIIGQHFECFYTEQDRQENKPRTFLRRAEAQGNHHEEGWRVRKDGKLFLADMTMTALRDTQGLLTGFAKVTRDITEERRMQGEILEQKAALQQSNTALEHSNIELKQFAYVASHDLQTPLRSISGFLQLIELQNQGKLDEKSLDWLQRTVKATEQMHALIRNVLAYSYIDARAQPFTPVELNEIFEEAVTLLDASIRDSKGEVTRDALPQVMGDRSQLLQLLQNLIGNGLKYRGDKAARVHVSAAYQTRDQTRDQTSNQAGEWVISIQDNGIGIAPKHHERVFEIFKRLHDQREYPGTGIGLSICRRVVQRHGGQIWVESEADQGSTFRFSLPEQQEQIS